MDKLWNNLRFTEWEMWWLRRCLVYAIPVAFFFRVDRDRFVVVNKLAAVQVRSRSILLHLSPFKPPTHSPYARNVRENSYGETLKLHLNVADAAERASKSGETPKICGFLQIFCSIKRMGEAMERV